MKFLYGPVFSRRLKWSLGVDLVPFKTCNFNCVFCQLGPTYKLESERKEFHPKEAILKEIEENIKKFSFDCISISGGGEPLLYKSLGFIIREIKKIDPFHPVAILTHSSFLHIDEIRKEVLDSDIILPSLDAGDEETFLRIARPHPSIKFENIVNGLIKLKEDFKGKYYLEVMFVKGLNDSEENILNLKKIIQKISPDKIHLNTPVRTPAYNWVLPLNEQELLKICKIFGEKAEIIADAGYSILKKRISQKEILSAIRRRPLSLKDIKDMSKDEDVLYFLDDMVKKGIIKKTISKKNKELYFSYRSPK